MAQENSNGTRTEKMQKNNNIMNLFFLFAWHFVIVAWFGSIPKFDSPSFIWLFAYCSAWLFTITMSHLFLLLFSMNSFQIFFLFSSVDSIVYWVERSRVEQINIRLGHWPTTIDHQRIVYWVVGRLQVFENRTQSRRWFISFCVAGPVHQVKSPLSCKCFCFVLFVIDLLVICGHLAAGHIPTRTVLASCYYVTGQPSTSTNRYIQTMPRSPIHGECEFWQILCRADTTAFVRCLPHVPSSEASFVIFLCLCRDMRHQS